MKKIKLKLKWVSDAIGSKYLTWKSGDIVVIKAQTGTGKSYFIKSILVGYAKSKGQRILLLCNRTDLKRQFKIDLMRYNNNTIPMTKDKDGKDIVDLELIDKTVEIGNVTIKSYQQYNEELLDLEYYNIPIDINYGYIIADECQWMTQDASFAKTRKTTQRLLATYNPDMIRIFMSATLDELIEPFKLAVDNEEQFHYYSTDEDYSYLDVKYFNNDKDIITLINNDLSDDKWVVFVTNKDIGAEFKKKITDSELITSGCKNDTRAKIVATESFDCKCLIATKVLDNGINLNDERIKHMVIYAWDKTTFIQELGRKRLDISKPIEEKFNLYIHTRFKKSFTTKINNLKKNRYSQIELFEKDPNKFNRKFNDELGKLDSQLFYKDKDNDKFIINLLGKKRLENDIEFFESMVEKFDSKDKFTFVKEQLSWLGLLKTFDKNNLIENVIDINESENVEEYLKEHLDEIIPTKEDRIPLIEKINLIDGHNSRLYKEIEGEDFKIIYVSDIEQLNKHLANSLKSNYRIQLLKRKTKIIDGKKHNYRAPWKIVHKNNFVEGVLDDKKSVPK
jgi:DNA or RNA helicases of superfamily II